MKAFDRSTPTDTHTHMHVCLSYRWPSGLERCGKKSVRGPTVDPPGSMHHTQSLSLWTYTKKSWSFGEHMCIYSPKTYHLSVYVLLLFYIWITMEHSCTEGALTVTGVIADTDSYPILGLIGGYNSENSGTPSSSGQNEGKLKHIWILFSHFLQMHQTCALLHDWKQF